MGKNRRGHARPTHEWELLLPLFEWPEQDRYEEIRPLVLFAVVVAKRADEVGVSTTTLYRRLDRFAEDGTEGLFDAPRRTMSLSTLALFRSWLVLKSRSFYSLVYTCK